MKSFLFIPDISGFSEFVQSTAVEHSNHIISELLELLIDSNEIGMELAEIEGDALFYYKYNDIPSLDGFNRQIESMFIKFYQHLKLYEHQRICNCGACVSAQTLKLKFVAHSGNFNFIQVKDQKKPFGDSVIEVHRLLKNNINEDEYVLVSDALNKNYNLSSPLFNDGYYDYDIGRVQYKYKILSDLKSRVQEYNPQEVNNDEKLLFTLNTTVKRSIQEMTELIINLNKRTSWSKGIEVVDFDPDKVNRVGTNHVCVINNKSLNLETVTKKGEPEQIVYGERTTDLAPALSSLTSYYILTPIDKETTEIKIEAFAKSKNLFQKLLRPLIKGKLKKSFLDALENIKMISASI